MDLTGTASLALNPKDSEEAQEMKAESIRKEDERKEKKRTEKGKNVKQSWKRTQKDCTTD